MPPPRKAILRQRGIPGPEGRSFFGFSTGGDVFSFCAEALSADGIGAGSGAAAEGGGFKGTGGFFAGPVGPPIKGARRSGKLGEPSILRGLA